MGRENQLAASAQLHAQVGKEFERVKFFWQGTSSHWPFNERTMLENVNYKQ